MSLRLTVNISTTKCTSVINNGRVNIHYCFSNSNILFDIFGFGVEDLLMFPPWQEAARDLLVLAAEVGCYTGASLSALIAWRLAKVTPVSDI